jgi:hypothetical protein
MPEETDLLSLLSMGTVYALEIINAKLEYSNNARTFIQINRLPFVGVVPLIKKFGCNPKKQFFEGFLDFDVALIVEFFQMWNT